MDGKCSLKSSEQSSITSYGVFGTLGFMAACRLVAGCVLTAFLPALLTSADDVGRAVPLTALPWSVAAFAQETASPAPTGTAVTETSDDQPKSSTESTQPGKLEPQGTEAASSAPSTPAAEATKPAATPGAPTASGAPTTSGSQSPTGPSTTPATGTAPAATPTAPTTPAAPNALPKPVIAPKIEASFNPQPASISPAVDPERPFSFSFRYRPLGRCLAVVRHEGRAYS